MTIRKHICVHSLMICVCGALASMAHAASIDMRAGTHAHARLASSENNEKTIRNEELAVARDLRTRVEQGDAAAMNGLGMMYALGRGVSQSYGTALDVFRRAALQGQVPGMVNVGLLYDRHANQPAYSSKTSVSASVFRKGSPRIRPLIKAASAARDASPGISIRTAHSARSRAAFSTSRARRLSQSNT